MAATEAQKRATAKYRRKIEELRIHVPAGQREIIRSHAAARGETMNGFVNRAIREALERDGRDGEDD